MYTMSIYWSELYNFVLFKYLMTYLVNPYLTMCTLFNFKIIKICERGLFMDVKDIIESW